MFRKKGNNKQKKDTSSSISPTSTLSLHTKKNTSSNEGGLKIGDGNERDSSSNSSFLKSMNDPTIIERVRVTIKNAHVFKLPPRQTVSVGWRGADWKDKIWQGMVKVVERGDDTAVVLVNPKDLSVFAVSPVAGTGGENGGGAVDRCVDSSRYFVLRIENNQGRHMYIGVAFNERSDAFDFNTALEDSRREKEVESNFADIQASLSSQPLSPSSAVKAAQNITSSESLASSSILESKYGAPKDYRLKEGEKIHVSIPKSQPSSINKTNNRVGGTAAFDQFGKDHNDSSDVEEKNSRPPSRQTTKQQRKSNSDSFMSNFKSNGGGSGGLLLKPSMKDTPSRSYQQR